MKRYSFVYLNKNKKILELIEYLEEKYDLTFLDIIDLGSNFELKIPYINLSKPSKEIMFKSNEDFKKNCDRFCSNCNFPIPLEDLEPLKGNEENLKCCMACGDIVWEDGEFKD